jgi:hypothetical protein
MNNSSKVLLCSIGSVFICALLWSIQYAGWLAVASLFLFVVSGWLISKKSMFSELALTSFVGSIALIPHIIFLVLYNKAAEALPLVGGASFRHEPQLFALASAYENLVVQIHQWFEINLGGWHTWLLAALTLTLVIGLAAWRLWAAKSAALLKHVLTTIEIFVLFAASVTVLTNISIHEWTPDYQGKLEPRLAQLDRAKATDWLLQQIPIQPDSPPPSKATYPPPVYDDQALGDLKAPLAQLDRAKATDWLLQQIPIAARSNANSIQATYGPLLVRADQALPYQTPARLSGATLAALAASAALTANPISDSAPLDITPSALPLAPRTTTTSSTLAQASPSEIRSIDKELDSLEKTREAYREAAIKERDVLEQRHEVYRKAAIDAFVDVLGNVPVPISNQTVRAFVEAFVSDVLSTSLDKLINTAKGEPRPAGVLTAHIDNDPDFRNTASHYVDDLVRPSSSVLRNTFAFIPQAPIDEFLKGVKTGWVFTENSDPTKLFVHESESGGYLNNMLYHIEVEQDGSWKVYRKSDSGEFNQLVGSVRVPPKVTITSCTCTW